MPLFTKNNKTILFIHIPKTSGLSIRQFFLDNSFTVNWFISSYNAEKRLSSPQHRHREEIIRCLQKESISFDYSFAMVRNPVDRLVSEFFQQCRNAEPLHKKITRHGFNAWVDQVFALHEENPFYFDNHIRPQTEFTLKDTLIFKYENNHADLFGFLRKIDTVHGFHFNFKKFPHKGEAPNRTSIDIQPETLRKIQLFYQADFKAFYPDQHWEIP